MVEVHRQETVSEAEVRLGSLLDNRAEITSKVSARDHLVIIGILPYVTSPNLNRDANSVMSAHLHTGKLKVNPRTNRKRTVTKMQWLY